ncbi:NAD(P)-dependent oxidoreductase [Curtobacterium flaccumfaciens]|nr:NAD(P)-dependent oxidoreductase [Curtobacterium flaccumfaciens]
MSYRLAVTRAFAEPDGSTIFGDIGLHALTEAGIDWHVLDAPAHRIDAGEIADDDAVLVLGHERFDADSIPAGGRLRHVARFGAGFDAVDVDACTTAGIVVTNTAEAVRRPVAQASVAMLFALAHNLLQKDRLVRTGGWDDRAQWRGHGLDGRTIGVMGLGGIGRELAGALTALGLTVIAWNRSDRAAEARRLEIELVAFDDLFRRSDYVVLTVSGNAGTQHLVGARELGLMAPHASIVNVARAASSTRPRWSTPSASTASPEPHWTSSSRSPSRRPARCSRSTGWSSHRTRCAGRTPSPRRCPTASARQCSRCGRPAPPASP